MTLTVLADDNIPGLAHWSEYGVDVRRSSGRTIRPDLLADVDVLLVRSVTTVDESLLADSAVRFVGSATSGIDHVDRGYLESRGIHFAHAPGANANSVVEYVLSAVAAVDGQLERLFEGGVVGIVGYGHVGSALAARLDALGIAYRVYDPWLDPGSIPGAAALAEVLDCNVVSLHPELTRRAPWPSYHLLGPTELADLRGDTLLLNASRGPVVDNAALLALLEQGRGPHTVLDVWEGEPVVSPGLLARTTLGTPHIAGYSLDAKLRATQMLGAALAGHLEGEFPWAGDTVEAPPPVKVGEPASPAALLRSLLQSRYAIRADDARLREVVLQAGDERGEGFDRLRRTYTERRELAGSRVSCGSPRVEYHRLVEAMGCQLDESVASS